MNKSGFQQLYRGRGAALMAGLLGAATLCAGAQPPSKPLPAVHKPVPAPPPAVKAPPPSAGGANTGTPLELRMKFKPGDINRYQMTMRANIVLPGQPAQTVTRYDTDIGMTVQQRVLKSNLDGSADVAISTLNGSGTVNGQYFHPATNDKPAVITFDARNNIVTAKDLPKNANDTDVTGAFFSRAH